MTTSSDPFNLQRFVEAQRTTFGQALAEITAGAKRSHWMWFVFPQVAGLGVSPPAQHYAIGSRAEAEAYLAHVVLGGNLREITRAANAVAGRSAHAIFGSPDDVKFSSSMTLFDAISLGDVFAAALDKYFAGARDPLTLAFLRDGPRASRN
jgi:uncharacterized protein (DUF1810 family)